MGDVCVLEEVTVDDMFRNQIGDVEVRPFTTAQPDLTFDADLGPGLKWGLGLLLNTIEQPGMRAAGGGSWAGIFNSHFWVDRASGVTRAICLQLLPFFDPMAVQLYIDFERVLYASRADGGVGGGAPGEGAPRDGGVLAGRLPAPDLGRAGGRGRTSWARRRSTAGRTQHPSRWSLVMPMACMKAYTVVGPTKDQPRRRRSPDRAIEVGLVEGMGWSPGTRCSSAGS